MQRKQGTSGTGEKSMFDVRAVFSKYSVDNVAELTRNCAETGIVVLAFGTFALVESAEIRIKANGNVGSDEQSTAQIG